MSLNVKKYFMDKLLLVGNKEERKRTIAFKEKTKE